jgi:hypothetical protein
LKRKTGKLVNFTSDRAAHALNVLIADGKIAARDVTNALKRREQLIRDLRQRLVALEQGAVSTVERTASTATRRIAWKPKRKMSLARRAALKLHGKYLGHTRMLPKKAKARIRVIRGAKGLHAAIEAAKKMTEPAARRATPKWGRAQSRRPDDQTPAQRKLAVYQQRERPKPDKHGGSGAGRQQGGSGVGRERG